MNLLNFFKNLKLGVKLNVMEVFAFTILLAATVVIMGRSVQNLILQTGRQRAEQEAEVIQRRLAEVEREVLMNAKLLASRPGLVEAVVGRDIDNLMTIILVGAAPLDLDDIDVVDTAGVHLEKEAVGSLPHAESEKALITLALLGIEATGIVVEKEEHVEFLLAAVVPLRDASGAIVGGLLVGRKIDDEFLEEINFSREDIPLVLISEGQILAQSSTEEAYRTMMAAGASIYFDQAAIEQALKGQTVIAGDLIDLDGAPHAMAHVPLAVGDQTAGVIVVASELGRLITFQNQLTTNTALTFGLLGLVTMATVVLFARQNITVPLNKLQRVARQMAGGDYSQRIKASTRDEVGRLGQAFNEMAEAVQTRETELQALAEELKQRSRVIETSAEVSRSLSTILDEKELVSAVVEQVRSAFDYYYAHIYIFDEGRENLVMTGGTGEAGRALLAQRHAIPRDKGLVGRAAETNSIILISDVFQDPGWLPNPLLPETKAEVAVPIAIGEEVLGVLDVQHNLSGGLTQVEAELIQSIANQVAIALQNARLYEKAQHQANREALINTIGQKIQSATTIESVLQTAVRELGHALGSRQTSIQLNRRVQATDGKREEVTV